MKKIIVLLIFINLLLAKTFTVSYDPDYAPFSYEKNGKVQGLFIDIWKLWAKTNNYNLKFINGGTWENALLLAKNSKVDFFLGTDPYEKWMKASVTYYKTKTAIFTLVTNKKLESIGIIGDDYKKDLEEYFKNIKIISFNTYEELFNALEKHKVDAIYDDYLALVYYKIKHNYNTLKELDVLQKYTDVKAISNSQQNINLFNQGFKKIDKKELNEVIKRWNSFENRKDYKNILISVVIFVFIIVLVFIIINLRLKHLVNKKTQELRTLNENLERIVKKRTKQLEIAKEKALKSSEYKSLFLANMSHEIRTPLNSILGFLYLLKDEELNSSARRYVEIIEKSSNNLLNIINDILDFSKIESGKITVERLDFRLDEMIEEVTTLFYSMINEKHIIFKLNKENVNNMINTDPTRLKQVIINLLGNAIKFTPENKTITLNIKYDEKKEILSVSVEDEGIGIPKDKIKHIFEAFSQADNSTTRKYGGTGLGLTISYSLVLLLGGELKVESQEDMGSKFYFSIPAKKVTQKEELKKETKLITKEFNFNVLLAEDNKANQLFMKTILKKLGLNVDIASDGVEAVEIYTNNPDKYDVILMDENMPNMTGSVATKEIRIFERKNDIKPVLIIALTANALTGDKDKFLEAGMDEYLSKPLNIEKLKEILRKI